MALYFCIWSSADGRTYANKKIKDGAKTKSIDQTISDSFSNILGNFKSGIMAPCKQLGYRILYLFSMVNDWLENHFTDDFEYHEIRIKDNWNNNTKRKHDSKIQREQNSENSSASMSDSNAREM